MAGDVVGLMTELDHGRFAVVGHDRGSYVAYRTALDHAERVVPPDETAMGWENYALTNFLRSHAAVA